jgi:hypothetical protein
MSGTLWSVHDVQVPPQYQPQNDNVFFPKQEEKHQENKKDCSS